MSLQHLFAYFQTGEGMVLGCIAGFLLLMLADVFLRRRHPFSIRKRSVTHYPPLVDEGKREAAIARLRPYSEPAAKGMKAGQAAVVNIEERRRA